MVKRIHIFLPAATLAFGVAQNSQAALFDVSPVLVVPPAPANLGTGFPQWYQDFSRPITRPDANPQYGRSEEHTSELQSLMRISYAVFCLKKKNKNTEITK